jgi:glucokinase
MTTTQPPTRSAMPAPGPLRVGVDIGGSKVAVLVVDPSGTVVGRELAPSVAADPDLAIGQIAAVIRSAVASAGATMDVVEAVGVGVPGRVDRASGAVTFAVNLGWQHLPLGERLAADLGVPVAVENDVRTAAAGLHERAPFGRIDDLAYLSIGTGISAGIVLGGRLHRGVRGVAGEIGHVVLEPDGPRCACGLDGCFEALAAGSAIARAARDAVAAGATTTLAALAEPTAEDVFAAAAAGDPPATAIVDRATTWIARMVHALVLTYDVRLVAIGGGVSKAGDPLLDRIRAALDAICAGSPFARELLSETEVRLLSPDLEIGPWGAIALIADGPTVGDRGRRPGEEVVAREAVR